MRLLISRDTTSIGRVAAISNGRHLDHACGPTPIARIMRGAPPFAEPGPLGGQRRAARWLVLLVRLAREVLKPTLS